MRKLKVVKSFPLPSTEFEITKLVRQFGRTRRDRRRLRREIQDTIAANLKEAARSSELCGAATRNGTSCRRKGRGRGGRCPNHGGCSTGPRTPEGKARISQASRKRWARWRSEREVR
jgi:hypothetical protein